MTWLMLARNLSSRRRYRHICTFREYRAIQRAYKLVYYR